MMRYANGDVYDGAWEDDRHNAGRLRSADGEYAGEWVRGKREGEGSMRWPGGDSYEGAWRRDRRHEGAMCQ